MLPRIPPLFTLLLGVLIATQPAAVSSLDATAPDGPVIPLVRVHGDPTYSANPSDFFAHGNDFYYTAFTSQGRAFWKSDGTPEGTGILLQIEPAMPSFYSFRGEMAVVGTTLYIAHSRTPYPAKATISRLYRSDGTPQGTQLLTDTINPYGLFSFGGALYFSATDNTGRSGLYRSDGTPQGTTLITRPGCSLPPAILGKEFFCLRDSASTGSAIWKSDGTAQGTTLLKDISPGLAGRLTVAGGKLYFDADDGTGRQIWVSDGTTQGTRPLMATNPGAMGFYDYHLTPIGDMLYFSAATSRTLAIARTDGTPQGTVFLTSLPSTYGSFDVELTAVGEKVFFTDAAPSNTQLWQSDGTPQGTKLVMSAGGLAAIKGLEALNGTLYFKYNHIGQPELWTSDGTPQGTRMVTRIGSARISASSSDQLVRAGRYLFFSASEREHGDELWVSDGTASGTRRLYDVESRKLIHYPLTIQAAGHRLFFTVYSPETGYELWTSDGTLQGTSLLKDIVPGPGSSWPRNITALGDRLAFFADDGITGYELWISDGTPQGTSPLKDIIPAQDEVCLLSPVAIGRQLVFASCGQAGTRLWKTDGTATGTVPIISFDSSSIEKLFVGGGKLFFSLVPAQLPSQIWSSDGTVQGTIRLTSGTLVDVADGPGGSAFLALKQADSLEIWKSDGTAAGTTLARRFPPQLAQPVKMSAANGILYFAADDGVSGVELWKSDGTPQGTTLVRDILPGRGGGLNASTQGLPSETSRITPVGTQVYFAATDGVSGVELWTSDGTTEGTRLVANINSKSDSTPDRLTTMGGTLVFIANDGVSGFELWSTDGSTAGTTRIQDLKPGAEGGLGYWDERFEFRPYSIPICYQTLVFGDDLYFVGEDAQSYGLWKLAGGVDGFAEPNVAGVAPGGSTAIALRYGNSRFTPTPLVLTATLGTGLSYQGDSSGITPTLVASNIIRWELPATRWGVHRFMLLLRLTPGATLGTRYPVEIEVAASDDADPGNNRASNSIFVARQHLLPLIFR